MSKKRRVSLALIAAAALSVGAFPVYAEEEYPLLLPDIPVHDPYVVANEEEQMYYLYTSGRIMVNENEEDVGVLVYKSKDLIHWQAPDLDGDTENGITNNLVYTVTSNDENPEYWNDGSAPWAPEVHEYNGKYYLFTTLANQEEVLEKMRADRQAYGTEHRWQDTYYRASIIAESDSPTGPFKDLSPSAPVTPRDLMTLDGTLYVDPDGQPWLVYAHEWLQKIDGTIEAIPLTEDLKAASGEPIYLFKGSDAPWYSDTFYGAPLARGDANYQTAEEDTLGLVNSEQLPPYVTDGPCLYETENGSLVMLWTSYRMHNQEYVETQAISRTGSIYGPWEQLEPLVGDNKGHGMVFDTFDGTKLMIMHNNMNSIIPDVGVRAEIYEVELTNDGFRVIAHRGDLDGTEQKDVSDKTAPVLYLPSTRVVKAEGESVAVHFEAMAKDNVDGWIQVQYSKEPDTEFSKGITEVVVTATDAAGNTEEGSFNVVVE